MSESAEKQQNKFIKYTKNSAKYVGRKIKNSYDSLSLYQRVLINAGAVGYFSISALEKLATGEFLKASFIGAADAMFIFFLYTNNKEYKKSLK